MEPSPLTLTRYYACLDGGAIGDALELLSPECTFALLLPADTVRGSSRSDMHDYLKSRPPVVRRHVPMRTGRDRDAEFLYGAVTDQGTTTGHFLATARIDSEGRIATYQVAFDVELRVFD